MIDKGGFVNSRPVSELNLPPLILNNVWMGNSSGLPIPVTPATVLSTIQAVPLAGGTMTGPLILNADPTAALGACTKQYADAISAGFTFEPLSYAATTVNLNTVYYNGSDPFNPGMGATLTNAGTQAVFTVDGTTPPLNSALVIKNQTAQLQNGLYILTNVGSVSTNWVLTRASYYDTPGEIQSGDLCAVQNGTLNASTFWLQTNDVLALGTDPINFQQFGSTIAVSTLTGTANQVLVNGTSGVATSGPITLTLPQNIGTAATPNFAGLTTTNSTFTVDGLATTIYSFGPSTTTGTFNIGGTGANTGAVTLWGGTGAQTINYATSSGGKTLNFGTGAGANILTLGSTNTTSSLTMLVGTGNFSLDGVAASTYSVGVSTTTGTFDLGGTAQTGTITLGKSTATNTVNLANASITGSNVQTINIGSGGTATTAHTAINILNGNNSGSGTDVLSLISGTGTKTLTIGNYNATTLALQGNLTLPTSSSQTVSSGITVSQSGTTLTGSGFSSSMVGGIFRTLNGSFGFITGYTDSTHLTVAPSQTIASTTAIIYYQGTQFDKYGNLGIQNLYLVNAPVISAFGAGIIQSSSVGLLSSSYIIPALTTFSAGIAYTGGITGDTYVFTGGGNVGVPLSGVLSASNTINIGTGTGPSHTTPYSSTINMGFTQGSSTNAPDDNTGQSTTNIQGDVNIGTIVGTVSGDIKRSLINIGNSAVDPTLQGRSTTTIKGNVYLGDLNGSPLPETTVYMPGVGVLGTAGIDTILGIRASDSGVYQTSTPHFSSFYVGTQALGNSLKFFNLTSADMEILLPVGILTIATLAGAIELAAGGGDIGLTAGAGAINITAGAGIITMNAGTGGIVISGDAASCTCDFATGSGNKTVYLGSTSGSSALTLQSGSGNISFAGNAQMTATKTFTLAQDPVAALEAATKQYVDANSGGGQFKTPVYAATRVGSPSLVVTYNNGTAGVGATLTNAGTQLVFGVDGVTVPVGQLVMIKDQTSTLQNGVYIVTTAGSGSINWVLTRYTGYDTPGEIKPGDFFVIVNGSVNKESTWIQTATVTTIGTDAIVFAQSSPGPTFLVTSVTGTTQQVLASTTVGNVVLSTPQNLDLSANFGIGTLTVGTTANTSGNITATNFAASAAGTTLALRKIRNSAAITSGDALGLHTFSGYDGTGYIVGSQITSTNSGTVATNRIASDLKFYTHPDSTTASTLRMTIAPTGAVTIASPDSGTGLTVSGGGASVTTGDIALNSTSSAAGSLINIGYLGGFNTTTTTISGAYVLNDGGTSSVNGSYLDSDGKFYHAGDTTSSAPFITFQCVHSGLGVVNGDTIGQINWTASTGTGGVYTPVTGSRILSKVSGTIASNRLPTTLEFYTHPDSTSASTQRMIISAAGNVTINAADSGTSLVSSGAVDFGLTNGQLLIGSTGAAATKGTLTAGGGITITNAAGSITISSGSGGFSWTTVSGSTQAMAAENGYIAANGTLTTFTLPPTAVVGDTFVVTGNAVATGWKIAQNASQKIYIGTTVTTTGTGGSLQSTQIRDTVTIVCVATNTDFQVMSMMGNITIV